MKETEIHVPRSAAVRWQRNGCSLPRGTFRSLRRASSPPGGVPSSRSMQSAQAHFLGRPWVSQLQLRGAHQAQGSGFFWSQAALQGPSHCSGMSTSRGDEKKEGLAARHMESGPPALSPQGLPGQSQGSEARPVLLLLKCPGCPSVRAGQVLGLQAADLESQVCVYVAGGRGAACKERRETRPSLTKFLRNRCKLPKSRWHTESSASDQHEGWIRAGKVIGAQENASSNDAK